MAGSDCQEVDDGWPANTFHYEEQRFCGLYEGQATLLVFTVQSPVLSELRTRAKICIGCSSFPAFCNVQLSSCRVLQGMLGTPEALQVGGNDGASRLKISPPSHFLVAKGFKKSIGRLQTRRLLNSTLAPWSSLVVSLLSWVSLLPLLYSLLDLPCVSTWHSSMHLCMSMTAFQHRRENI